MATTADEVIIQQTNQYPFRSKDRQYTYPSYFVGGIFKSIKTVPWMVGQSTDAYWALNRRENREYLYQHIFNRHVKHGLKTVPWVMTFSLYAANSYLNMKRMKEINKVYSTYPSFFMNIKTIPSKKTIWVKQGEVSDGWIKQPEIP